MYKIILRKKHKKAQALVGSSENVACVKALHCPEASKHLCAAVGHKKFSQAGQFLLMVQSPENMISKRYLF